MKEMEIDLNRAGKAVTDLVERARLEQTTFVVVDRGTPVARLVPDLAKRCTAGELAMALDKMDLPPEEAQAWAEDMQKSRAKLLPPSNKWE